MGSAVAPGLPPRNWAISSTAAGAGTGSATPSPSPRRPSTGPPWRPSPGASRSTPGSRPWTPPPGSQAVPPTRRGLPSRWPSRSRWRGPWGGSDALLAPPSSISGGHRTAGSPCPPAPCRLGPPPFSLASGRRPRPALAVDHPGPGGSAPSLPLATGSRAAPTSFAARGTAASSRSRLSRPAPRATGCPTPPTESSCWHTAFYWRRPSASPRPSAFSPSATRRRSPSRGTMGPGPRCWRSSASGRGPTRARWTPLPASATRASSTGCARGPAQSGSADGAEPCDGPIIPVEFKSCNSPRGGVPYPSHRVQFLAYCVLVEETYGRVPPYGVLPQGDGGSGRSGGTRQHWMNFGRDSWAGGKSRGRPESLKGCSPPAGRSGDQVGGLATDPSHVE